MHDVGHYISGKIEFDSNGIGVGKIQGVPGRGRIETFEITGTYKTQTAGEWDDASYFDNPDQLEIYVFNSEVAMCTFAEQQSIDLPTTYSKDMPDRYLRLGADNPAMYLVFSKKYANGDTLPDYPELISVPVNVDWDLGRTYQIFGTQDPLNQGKTRYSLYVLIKNNNTTDRTDLAPANAPTKLHSINFRLLLD